MDLPAAQSSPSTEVEGDPRDIDLGPLFTRFSLNGIDLLNRFVMAPMTREFSPCGIPGVDVAEYYARRAAHVGLIVTEGTYVDHPSAGSSDRVPRFYGEQPLASGFHLAGSGHGV